MNNFEKIKSCSIDELATYLICLFEIEFNDSACNDFCSNCDDYKDCKKLPIRIKKWLESETISDFNKSSEIWTNLEEITAENTRLFIENNSLRKKIKEIKKIVNKRK